MLKAIAFGLAAGAGLQAWRAYPPSSPLTGDSLAVVFAVGVLCAYLGGRWHGRGRTSAVAVAQAEATAVASNHVNVAVVVPGAGAGASVSPYAVPTESAPWVTTPISIPELTADQLEGMDLSELVEEHEQSWSEDR